MAKTTFTKLNQNWNAEPNAPDPKVSIHENNVVLKFFVNAFIFHEFEEDDIVSLTFVNCSKYMLNSLNDEGWYMGQCRFSKIAPKWGEFYKITGDSLLEFSENKWITLYSPKVNQTHFLFYMRDNTFECFADSYNFKKEIC